MRLKLGLLIATALVLFLIGLGSLELQEVENQLDVAEVRIVQLQEKVTEVEALVDSYQNSLTASENELARVEADLQEALRNNENLEDLVADLELVLAQSSPDNCFELSLFTPEPIEIYLDEMLFEGLEGHSNGIDSFVSSDERVGVMAPEIYYDVFSPEIGETYDIVIFYSELTLLCNDDFTNTFVFYGNVNILNKSECIEDCPVLPPSYYSDDVNA